MTNLKKRYSLLVVSDSEDLIARIEQCASLVERLCLLPAARGGEAALKRLRGETPDLMLVQMIMPRMDGVELLERIRAEKLCVGCKIFALSPIIESEVIRMVQGLGVTYYIPEPMSETRILRRMLDFLPEDAAGGVPLPPVREKSEALTREEIITNYLRAVGVPAHLNGYRYVRAAIEYNVLHYDENPGLTTDIYMAVAKQFNTRWNCVERDIRTAIERAWYQGNLDKQHKLFGYTVDRQKGRPTNKEFISMITERVVMRLKQR